MYISNKDLLNQIRDIQEEAHHACDTKTWLWFRLASVFVIALVDIADSLTVLATDGITTGGR